MSVEMKFILFQAVIILPLLSGIFFKQRFKNPEKLARRIINLNLSLFQPLIILWSVWGMKLSAGLFVVNTVLFILVVLPLLIFFRDYLV